VLRRPPNLVGNSGAEAGPGLSASHARKTRTVPVVSGVRRSRLPFPAQWTLAPDNSSTSPRVKPVSSETLKPAWSASANSA
jgi:hypothetical protein